MTINGGAVVDMVNLTNKTLYAYMVLDEENRLAAIKDDNYLSHYWCN